MQLGQGAQLPAANGYPPVLRTAYIRYAFDELLRSKQFAMGDFKDVLTGIVIDAQDAQNNIADQLLKDERIFGVMQRMLAKMVWQQFQPRA